MKLAVIVFYAAHGEVDDQIGVFPHVGDGALRLDVHWLDGKSEAGFLRAKLAAGDILEHLPILFTVVSYSPAAVLLVTTFTVRTGNSLSCSPTIVREYLEVRRAGYFVPLMAKSRTTSRASAGA